MCRGAQAEPPAHADPDILPQETLRKYITYAKHHCRPKLQNADYDKIAAARARAPGAAGARSASCGLSDAGVACLAWYAHLHLKSASPQEGRTYKPLVQKGPSACVHAARAYALPFMQALHTKGILVLTASRAPGIGPACGQQLRAALAPRALLNCAPEPLARRAGVCGAAQGERGEPRHADRGAPPGEHHPHERGARGDAPAPVRQRRRRGHGHPVRLACGARPCRRRRAAGAAADARRSLPPGPRALTTAALPHRFTAPARRPYIARPAAGRRSASAGRLALIVH